MKPPNKKVWKLRWTKTQNSGVWPETKISSRLKSLENWPIKYKQQQNQTRPQIFPVLNESFIFIIKKNGKQNYKGSAFPPVL